MAFLGYMGLHGFTTLRQIKLNKDRFSQQITAFEHLSESWSRFTRFFSVQEGTYLMFYACLAYVKSEPSLAGD